MGSGTGGVINDSRGVPSMVLLLSREEEEAAWRGVWRSRSGRVASTRSSTYCTVHTVQYMLYARYGDSWLRLRQ